MEKNPKEKIPRKPLTTKERIAQLTNLYLKWLKEGISPEDAQAKFTMKQWDFLVEKAPGVIDEMTLNNFQKQAIQEIIRAPRPLFPDGYKNKKYPENKREIYNALVKFLQDAGFQIADKGKENYRDIYVIDGTGKKWTFYFVEDKGKGVWEKGVQATFGSKGRIEENE